MQAVAGPGLPSEVLLQVHSFLPLVDRVRWTLVSRFWRARVRRPDFWAELRFNGVAEGILDWELIVKLCRRAGANLRTLDLSDPECGAIDIEELFRDLAAEGVGTTLETLRTWAPYEHSAQQGGRNDPLEPRAAEAALEDAEGPLSAIQALRDWASLLNPTSRNARRPFRIGTAADASAILAAFPALRSAAVEVEGRFADALAAVLALPGPGPKSVVCTVPRDAARRAVAPRVSLEEAAGMAAALAPGCADIRTLVLAHNDLSADGGCASIRSAPLCPFVDAPIIAALKNCCDDDDDAQRTGVF